MHFPISRRHFVLAAAAAAAAPLRAQDVAWPSRPIKAVVPSGAGSVGDQIPRLICERLGAALKQPMIIDNKPGANGAIATMAVKNAAPDGYTFLMTTASASVMAEALTPNLSFSTLRDFQPIALTAVGGVMLVVHPDVPANNLPDLVKLLKAQPNKYPSYGSWGVGSNGHLTMEWIKQRTGMQTSHVAYKTVASLLPDVVSGLLPIAWVDVTSPIGLIQQGRLRPICVNGDLRFPKLPDVQTMTEQGMPFPATGWQGMFAHKDTPMAIVRRMHEEVSRVLVQPALIASMREMNVGATPIWTRERFEAMLANDLKVWKQIVADGNIKAEG